MLWYSVKGSHVGSWFIWLCAHPDCSFVVRYDSVRPEESMRGLTGWERRMHVRMRAELEMKKNKIREGNWTVEMKAREKERKGKWVEEKTERVLNWGGGVNMLLFTVVSLKCCNFYKWTSFEILFQGNNNTWTAEMHFLLLEIYCTLESKPSRHHDFSPQSNLAKLYLNSYYN